MEFRGLIDSPVFRCWNPCHAPKRVAKCTERLQRGIAASPFASDQWIVVKDSLEDILSNRSRGVLPRKFNALWPNPECEMATGRTLKFDPHSGFGSQIGARVALLRCPVPRLSGNNDDG